VPTPTLPKGPRTNLGIRFSYHKCCVRIPDRLVHREKLIRRIPPSDDSDFLHPERNPAPLTANTIIVYNIAYISECTSLPPAPGRNSEIWIGSPKRMFFILAASKKLLEIVLRGSRSRFHDVDIPDIGLAFTRNPARPRFQIPLFN